jgi:hypothetical protein
MGRPAAKGEEIAPNRDKTDLPQGSPMDPEEAAACPLPPAGRPRAARLRFSRLALLFAALACLLAPAAPAGAATITSHEFSASFDGSATPAGSLGLAGDGGGGGGSPTHYLAFNQQAKKLYVIDPVRDAVNVFTAAGAFDSQIKGKDVPQGSLDLDGAAIAVDDSGGPTQGRVYIAAPDQDVIFAFGPTGAYLFQTSLGDPNETYGDIAVAPDGNVWISKVGGVGSETLYELNPSGAVLDFVPLSAVVPNDPVSGRYGNPHSLAFGLGGDLYVLDDRNGGRVLRLDPSGHLLEANFSIGDSLPRGFAADPATGNVYVIGYGHLYVGSCRYGTRRVEAFDASGNFIDTFGNEVVGVKEHLERYYDPETGEPLTKEEREEAEEEGTLESFPKKLFPDERYCDPDTGEQISLPEAVEKAEEEGYPKFKVPITRLEVEFKGESLPAWDGEAGRSLAVDRSTGAVYVGIGSGVAGVEEIFVFAPKGATAPEVTIRPADAITESSATIQAAVDPAGHPTVYHVDYRKPSDTTWNVGPTESAGEGSGPAPVSREVTGLEFGTTYEVRVQAQSTDTNRVGADSSAFKTTAHAPDVETAPAAPRGTTSARLNARIDPNGGATSYYFEYGPDESYGTSAPAALDGDAGDERGVVVRSEEVAGLSPDTTYHYRVIAENTIGRVEGADLVFTTRAPSEVAIPERGIELASSPDKSAQNVAVAYLAPDRDRVLWTTTGGTPLSTSGGATTFIADRTPGGWVSRPLAPPLAEQLGGGQLNYTKVEMATADFSRFFVDVTAGILGGAERYWVRLDDHGGQTLLAHFAAGEAGPNPSRSVNDDMSRIYSGVQPEPAAGWAFLDPLHLTGANVYEFAAGAPRLVGRLPDGSVPDCVTYVDSAGGGNRYGSWATTDTDAAQRLYFQTNGDHAPCGGKPTRLYVRDLDAEETTLISAPPLAGEEGAASFVRASADGATAIFTTATRLDPDDANAGSDIYRYRVGAGVECLTCEVAADAAVEAPNSGVIVSEDLLRIYFSSKRRLTPGLGPRQGAQSLYLLHDGQLRFVAPLKGALTKKGNSDTTGPDGRVLVFGAEGGRPTDDDQASTEQYYRYDDADGSLECVTCPPAGQAQPGGALGASADLKLNGSQQASGKFEQSSSADGQTVVFSSAVAYVPEDVNRSYDVYEWRNGAYGLITDGVTKYPTGKLVRPSTPSISRDGANVLFAVGAALTGHELDQTNQVYVARVGGGFPPPPTPPVPCSEDSCQGSLQAAPGAPNVASAAFSGPGDARPRTDCTRRARSLSRRAQRLGRSAKRIHGGQARRMRRRAGRLAKRARRQSRIARRCRARANRGGVG